MMVNATGLVRTMTSEGKLEMVVGVHLQGPVDIRKEQTAHNGS